MSQGKTSAEAMILRQQRMNSDLRALVEKALLEMNDLFDKCDLISNKAKEDYLYRISHNENVKSPVVSAATDVATFSSTTDCDPPDDMPVRGKFQLFPINNNQNNISVVEDRGRRIISLEEIKFFQ